MAIMQQIGLELSSSSFEYTLGAYGLKDVHKVPTNGLIDVIRSIAEKREAGQPFYLLDLGTVGRLMARWNHSLPNVKPFYAVKCNSEPALLLALATLGANFDCASRAEIETVIRLGISPDQVVYANPCKAVSHIKYAAAVGVNLTTFDSKDEIEKFKKWHPKCSLLLRITVSDDKSSWRQLGTKFGAMPEEVIPLLREAHNAGLTVVGVSFHVGSIASKSRVYRDAIAAASVAFEAAGMLQLPQMHVLNIGGGFRADSIFNEIVETLKEAINDYFPQNMNLSVMAEPGRFFAETAFTLVTKVIGKRKRGERMEYWIDDGIYGSFNLPAYDRSSMMVSPLLMSSGDDQPGLTWPSTVFGPTCDSLDTVLTDGELPELRLNDVLIFHKMGAYTASAGTNFNGFNTSATPTYLAYTNSPN